jgi:Peptidase family M23
MQVWRRAMVAGLVLVLVAAGVWQFQGSRSCSSSSSSSSSLGSSAPSILLGTIDPVRSVQTQDEALVVYEVSILNSGETAVNLQRVDTTSGENLLASYAGSDLCERVSEPSTQIDPEAEPSTLIEPGAELLVFMWLPMPTDLPNQSLTHVVTMQSADAETEFEERLVVAIEDEDPVVLGPPLRGRNWLAFNNSDESPHSRNTEVFDDTVRIPMRYAIDLVRRDQDGSDFVGEFENNEDHLAYGEEILAVADGTIEAAVDGVPENVPGSPPASPIPLDARCGNCIILGIGNGQFVTYAHLIPGSLTVGVGDQVKKGDVLGRVGNSGASSGPHLHFHVSQIFDTQNASGLNGSALPFVFESFELLDSEGNSTGTRTLAIPMNEAFIAFP